MWHAFASAAARTTASNCRGESVIPGSTGAQITPARTPASRNCFKAWRRKSGRGALGSSTLASSASVVVTVTLTDIQFLREITRAILQEFARHSGLELGIVTKSAMVVRDIGLLREISRKDWISVSVTGTTTD